MLTRVAHASEEAKDVLNYVELIAPIFLFFFFVVVFLTNNIVEARKAQKAAGDDSPSVLGPGGRPLPRRMKSVLKVETCEPPPGFSEATRLFFLLLTVCMMITYLVNAVVIIAQTIVYREDHWWCGQPPVVSILFTCFLSEAYSRLGVCCGDLLRVFYHSHYADRYPTVSEHIPPFDVVRQCSIRGHGPRCINSILFRTT